MAMACSNDGGGVTGGNNTENPTKQRLLHSVKITTEGWDDECCLTFKYDDLNRIVEFSDIWYGESVDHCALYVTYNSDGTILHRAYYNGESDESIVTTNIDGTIATVYDKDNDETYYYQYDSEKHLTAAFFDDNYDLYEWRDGNMVKVTSKWGYMDEDEKYVQHLRYNDVSNNKTNIDVNWIVVCLCDMFIPHPYDLHGTNSLFGQRNANYVVNVTDDWGKSTFDWTFDKYGCPTKCILKEVYSESEEIITYTFEYLN